MTIIDTPEGIAFARFLAVRSALSLEVRTGMKMSRGRSILSIANEMMGTTFRRKADALAHMDAVHAEVTAQMEADIADRAARTARCNICKTNPVEPGVHACEVCE